MPKFKVNPPTAAPPDDPSLSKGKTHSDTIEPAVAAPSPNLITANHLSRLLKLAFFSLLIFAAGAGSSFLYFVKFPPLPPGGKSATAAASPYAEFLEEIYDKIQENFWDKLSDENLSLLFRLAAEKATGNPLSLASPNKAGLRQMLPALFAGRDEESQKELVLQMANLVLANLNPFGRSGLYSTKEETSLRQNVANINPEKDLYRDLDVDREASPEAIAKSFEQIKASLEKQKESSPEAQKKLEATQYAYEVLTNPAKRENYNKFGVEPTVFGQLVDANVYYLKIKKISPTTFEELKTETAKVQGEWRPNALILDLRGNIGGSIDLLPYLLGPFIGQNQYAFDLFHQGNYNPVKTQTGFLGSLLRYKKVVIFTDGQTQSSAEVIAATLKRYNVGVVLGNTSRGWGTVEKVFPLSHQIDPKERYSLFLVHSLTLRDDNQPIEGRGVEPTINAQDQNREAQLKAYFDSPGLINVIWETYRLPPD